MCLIVSVCVCVCVCIEEKDRRVLGIEWLLSAVHMCVGLLNAYAPRPDLPPDHSNLRPFHVKCLVVVVLYKHQSSGELSRSSSQVSVPLISRPVPHYH